MAKSKRKPGGLQADVVRDAVRAKLGAKVVRTTFKSEVQTYISTGIDVLDQWGLSRPGFPCGRFTEVFGDEGSGKSTLVLAAIRSCQRAGGTAVLIHTEQAYQRDRLIQLGVDPDMLVLIEPNDLEGALQALEASVQALTPTAGHLIAWDSFAATGTAEEYKQGVAPGSSFDKRAKLMSQALRVLPSIAASSGAAILIVNQNRSKIGVVFGSPVTQPGGHAPKYTSSVRIELYPGKAVPGPGGSAIGRHVTAKVWKNRMGPPLRKIATRILFASGFDNDWTTLNRAKELGLVAARSRDVGAAMAALQEADWQGSGPATEDDD